MPSTPPHRARYARRPAVIVSLAEICTFTVIGRSTADRGIVLSRAGTDRCAAFGDLHTESALFDLGACLQ
jgi:hypothetical protein